MNKTQLTQAMANTLECTKPQASDYLNEILKQIQTALCEGEKVYITHFGTFELRYCLAKTPPNANIDDNALLSLGYNKPSFKPANSLKQAVQEN